MYSSRRTRSKSVAMPAWSPRVRDASSVAESSCFCSSRCSCPRSASFASITCMPFAMSSTSTAACTRALASKTRVRSDCENGNLFTETASEPLHEHDGSALVVIELSLLSRQVRYAAFDETALDEPVLRARGEHEDPLQLLFARPRLDLGQQALTRARAAKVRVHGEAGELARSLLGEGIERGAADDHAVVLEHHEAPDLALEQIAIALDQRAVGLEGLDQLEHAADVLQPRRAQVLDGIGGQHGPHALPREELEQQAVV